MTWMQLLQATITILFVAVLLELFVALTLFHWRMWKEERARRRATREARTQQKTPKGE